MVEVGKEFDENAAFTHQSFIEPEEVSNFDAYGQDGNVGQPSVVYRVPFHFSAGAPIVASAATAAYRLRRLDRRRRRPASDRRADQRGHAGQRRPAPARQRRTGRRRPGARRRDRLHAARLRDRARARSAAHRRAQAACSRRPSATFTFRQSSDSGAPVIAYELRYAIAPDPTSGADESLYARWTPATPPAVDAPGTISQVEGRRPAAADRVLDRHARARRVRLVGAGVRARDHRQASLHAALGLRDRDRRLRQRARPRRRRCCAASATRRRSGRAWSRWRRCCTRAARRRWPSWSGGRTRRARPCGRCCARS